MQRIDFLGTRITVINPQETLNFLREYNYSKVGYVCFPDTYVITQAYTDRLLQKILNDSLLTVPDGKPLEFWARINGFSKTRTISGYMLIRELLKSDLSHYFYGGNYETIEKLKTNLLLEYPKANILGFRSPPFIDLADITESKLILEDIAEISYLQPDLLWIGISSPKQDYIMHQHYQVLTHGVMMGVGGVFDYLSGTRKISPEWIKKIGFRWLFRLIQEPGRLGEKYFSTIIKLMLIVAGRILSSGKKKNADN
jgi:N-acetylglucosaminyldiphosphoundecaprenol N-acetyl-beta-D-mannosaminyltransferase